MPGGGHPLVPLRGRVGEVHMAAPYSPAPVEGFDKHATTFEYDLWHGHRKLERDGVDPAFPFGFGLSYTTYACRGLRVDRSVVRASDTLDASVEVANLGSRAGEHVVQLYVHVPASVVERAPRTLIAFARVALESGETTLVHLRVPVSSFAYYDEARASFVVEPTGYDLIAGSHSLDETGGRVRVEVVP